MRTQIHAGKKYPPAEQCNCCGRMRRNQLLLFLFRGGGRRSDSLGGLSLREALLEFVHAASGINELLLARVKRMADVAYTDQNRRPGGAGLDHVAAGATYFRVHILRMNVRFHNQERTTYQSSAA